MNEERKNVSQEIETTSTEEPTEVPSSLEKRSAAQRLIDILEAGGMELWRDPNGDPYVTLTVKGGRAHFAVQSPAFERAAQGAFYHSAKKPIGRPAISEALDVISAMASYRDGVPTYAPEVRLAHHGGSIYVDLGREDRLAVEIDVSGYRTTSTLPPEVRFIRSPGMLELPVPTLDQDPAVLDKIRGVVNIPEGHHGLPLLLGFLIASFNPSGTYPILVLQGPQGRGKSTLARLVARLLDPQKVLVQSAPRSEEDLLIAAQNSFLLVFDNLSGIDGRMSDAISRLATGSGVRRRKLYSNSDETLISVARPVSINGIDSLTERSDLADRSVVINMPRITRKARKEMAHIESWFDEHYSSLLGGLYKAVSAALAGRDNVRLIEKPRMADASVFVHAAEAVLPVQQGTFVRTLFEAQERTARDNVEENAVAAALVRFMCDKDKPKASMVMSSSDLKLVLGSIDSAVEKMTPAKIRSQLMRAVPVLLVSHKIEVIYRPGSKNAKNQQVYEIWNHNQDAPGGDQLVPNGVAPSPPSGPSSRGIPEGTFDVSGEHLETESQDNGSPDGSVQETPEESGVSDREVQATAVE